MESFSEIKTRRDLADYIGVKYSTLNYVLYHMPISKKYKSFSIPKKNGGERIINAPTDKLKCVQRRLADVLVEHQNRLDFVNGRRNTVVHGFVKNKSFITNASAHRNRYYVINLDIKDFFDSFNYGRVYGFFMKNRDYLLPSEAAAAIAGICCYKGVLPQGAPTSPIITNLICRSMDVRLLHIAKKYHVVYTRYADDMTFSTNELAFFDKYELFLKDIKNEIENSGFLLNEEKNRLQYKYSHQEVTGLTVNKKINVPRDYYKKTRAMAHTLFKTGEYYIDGKEQKGTISQLEGRFAYINQLDWYNNRKNGVINNKSFSARENDYKLFLFYKYFYANKKTTIVTEGKTDIIYIKCALKKLYSQFPKLISKNSDGKYCYNVSFLQRTKRLKYFLNIQETGADSMSNIAKEYCSKKDSKRKNSYDQLFGISQSEPKIPVVLLFDNELGKEGSKKKRPLQKFTAEFVNRDETIDTKIRNGEPYNIKGNLYLMAIPCPQGMDECEIEDLFTIETLNTEINGKTFFRIEKDFDENRHYSKDRFSKYIMEHYSEIDFSGFIPLLTQLDLLVKEKT